MSKSSDSQSSTRNRQLSFHKVETGGGCQMRTSKVMREKFWDVGCKCKPNQAWDEIMEIIIIKFLLLHHYNSQ
jgi:hypothetical protein